MTSLSDEIVLSALAYAERRDIAAAASVSHRWNDVVNNGEGSAPLWRALVERHHPVLIRAAPGRAPVGGWRDLFLRTERLVALAHSRLREEVSSCAASIGNAGELFGSCCDWISSRPYASPTSGTTATEVPGANGAYSLPVYYDWGANWERVKALVPTPEVQKALKRSVNKACNEGYFDCDSWDNEKVWPFLFSIQNGNGEQDALMRELLPSSFVGEMNRLVASWFLARGETLMSGEGGYREGGYNPKFVVEGWMTGELEFGERIENEEGADLVEELVGEMIEDLYHMLHSGQSDLMRAIRNASEKKLYDSNGPLRETLLCTLRNSYAFMPLNYVLAKLLSPEDAQLRVYASSEYSVVIDERRNIVFDNFWYFVGVSPVETLERSRDRPNLPGLISRSEVL